MSRTLPEWIGDTDDSPVPSRVRLRIFDAAKGRCQSCTRKLSPADAWEVDHVVAIVNQGPNAEHNLQLLCSWCHEHKTGDDVAEKSKTYAIRSKFLGVERKRSRWGWRR